MGRLFGLAMFLAVVGGAYYGYMRQPQSATLAGGSNPAAAVDTVGVKRDLMSIARAERMHMGMYGKYVPLAELRSSGDLTMNGDTRGPYTYSVEVSGSSFRATATYSGPPSAMAYRVISIDESMSFTTSQ